VISNEGVLNDHKGKKSATKNETQRAVQERVDGMFLALLPYLPVNYQQMLDQNIDFM
jgi:hypothetical protein